MLPSFLYLSIIFATLVIVGQLSSTLENVRATEQKVTGNSPKRGSFFTATKKTRTKYRRIGEKIPTYNSLDFARTNLPKRLEERRSRTKNAKTALILRDSELRRIDSNVANEIVDNGQRADFDNEEKKPFDYFEERRDKFKIKKKGRITDDHVTRNKARKDFSTETMKQFLTETEQITEPLNVTCTEFVTNESSLSLRRLFRVPRVYKFANCSGRKRLVARTREDNGPSSAVATRSIDRGHTDLINQYEKEQSMDDIGVEYVHPEGHKRRSPRRVVSARTIFRNQSRNGVSSINNDYDIIEHDYFSLINKRLVRGLINDKRRELSKEPETKEHISIKHNSEELKKLVQNSTSRFSLNHHDIDKFNLTENPWPLVPGPISCDLDFQLRPSFVAKLGEFDYVVSVQRQRNPDEPAEHSCTGVVYNRRFVVIAPHCLNDNYGLTVTSTDDLCTIDEMIDVDYIIEHENYDPETRRNDIALIKLKSEIHKRAAEFPNDDDALGRYFYAVGFGELLWKSFPNSVSKLLQKVPVQRYHQAFKEVPGTLHITTSHMDLTGVFRGDFGGALINTRGEFVGLKSKFVKRSTEFEVYTKVGAYLPWIKSMVALHGSW